MLDTDLGAKELAKLGDFYMQEAILMVLHGAPDDGLSLGELVKLTRPSDPEGESITTACLNVLAIAGRVHQPGGPGTKWSLAPGERTAMNEA